MPALSWRAKSDAGGGVVDEVVSGALDAAGAALDASVSPAPEPVSRAAAWLVLAVAKSAAKSQLARGNKRQLPPSWTKSHRSLDTGLLKDRKEIE